MEDSATMVRASLCLSGRVGARDRIGRVFNLFSYSGTYRLVAQQSLLPVRLWDAPINLRVESQGM